MNMPFSGYPILLASRTETVLDHIGPKSYTTGGELLVASDLGLSSLEWLQASAYTMSGNYTVVILYPAGLFYNVSSVHMAWYNVADGSQVTNGIDLSGEHIRMLVKGIA